MDSSCWTNWKSDEEIHRILQQRKDNGENKRAASIGLQTAALCSTRILEASPTFGSRFNFVRPAFCPLPSLPAIYLATQCHRTSHHKMPVPGFPWLYGSIFDFGKSLTVLPSPSANCHLLFMKLNEEPLSIFLSYCVERQKLISLGGGAKKDVSMSGFGANPLLQSFIKSPGMNWHRLLSLFPLASIPKSALTEASPKAFLSALWPATPTSLLA